LGRRQYGFNRQYSGVFAPYGESIASILDNHEPERLSGDELRRLRLSDEEERFDLDHYVADFAEADQLQPCLEYHPWWIDAYRARKQKNNDDDNENDDVDPIEFSEEQKRMMLSLPNKECQSVVYQSIS
jgi:hypothetical protein